MKHEYCKASWFTILKNIILNIKIRSSLEINIYYFDQKIFNLKIKSKNYDLI